MIKAYHQVGSDELTPAQRKASLKAVLEDGEIAPAIGRVQRLEMEKECFVTRSKSQSLRFLSRRMGPEAEEALVQMTLEKLALLPEKGSMHTMFNCLDLLAGDFERVFLSVGDWFSTPNGFVFDAETLLLAGASYREKDFLGYYGYEVEEAARFVYDSVEDARLEMDAAFERVREKEETTGKAAVTLLRNDCAGQKCYGEIVWPGPLPLELATGMWSEGRRVRL